jgi:hypothetical protein
VASREGEGTTFTIRLPLAASAGAQRRGSSPGASVSTMGGMA